MATQNYNYNYAKTAGSYTIKTTGTGGNISFSASQVTWGPVVDQPDVHKMDDNIYRFEPSDEPGTTRCCTCWALVMRVDQVHHIDWHDQILGRLMESMLDSLVRIKGELENDDGTRV